MDFLDPNTRYFFPPERIVAGTSATTAVGTVRDLAIAEDRGVACVVFELLAAGVSELRCLGYLDLTLVEQMRRLEGKAILVLAETSTYHDPVGWSFSFARVMQLISPDMKEPLQFLWPDKIPVRSLNREPAQARPRLRKASY